MAVLLLDRSGSHLVAHAERGGSRRRCTKASGCQSVRVSPVGSPRRGHRSTLDEVGPDTVVNPILWEQGVRSMLGVPLITDGRLLGVMHVGTREPRQFTAMDIESLEREAPRVAER